MKKLLFLVTLSLIFNFSYSQSKLIAIGKLDNNRIILTANAENMCKSLSKNLAKVSEVVENFTKVEIIKKESAYFLVFKGTKYTTTFLVVEDAGKLMGQMNVSCSSNGDCANTTGCTVSQNVGECLCTSCPGDGNCVKTCSTSTLVDDF